MKEQTIQNNVTFVGLNKLVSADQAKIKSMLFEHYDLLARELKEVTGLKLNFKEHKKEGSTKYEIQMTITTSTSPITVNKASSKNQWDPVAMVHELIEKAKQEIKHKYKL